MPNRYRDGRRAEERVARQLWRQGATVKLSPGSRGPNDLVVAFAGTEWGVQVKSSRRDRPATPGRRELARLRQSATLSGRTPVVAEVTPKGIAYRSARSGRKLNPPKRR